MTYLSFGSVLHNRAALYDTDLSLYNEGYRMAHQRSWYEVVIGCQTILTRLRPVLTTGGACTPEMQADLDEVVLAIRNYCIGQTRLLAAYDEEQQDDVLFRVID